MNVPKGTIKSREKVKYRRDDMQRTGDIHFNALTTAEIIEYMSNITCPNLCMVTLTLTGKHNTYTYSSQLVCTGYTNNTPVSAVALDYTSYVF